MGRILCPYGQRKVPKPKHHVLEPNNGEQTNAINERESAPS